MQMTLDSWRAVNAVPGLRPDEAHVWTDSLSMSAPWASPDSLSEDEAAQAARMTAPTRRAVFVRGRSALRFLAGQYLGVRPAEVAVRLLQHGKPVVDVPRGSQPLVVSMAHTGETIVVAFARADAIGVDIEGEDPSVDRAAVARRFFSAAEAAGIAELPEADRLHAFFALWVRKEALLKAAGDGLTVPLAEVELEVTRDPELQIRRLPSGYGLVEDWTVRALATGSGMAGAVAVRGGVQHISQLRWAY